MARYTGPRVRISRRFGLPIFGPSKYGIVPELVDKEKLSAANGILEAFTIPYTFSDPMVLAVTLDKAMTKTITSQAGVATAPIRHNPYMLRAQIDQFEVTIFPDARAIIKGTSDPAKARSLYAKYFGA